MAISYANVQQQPNSVASGFNQIAQGFQQKAASDFQNKALEQEQSQFETQLGIAKQEHDAKIEAANAEAQGKVHQAKWDLYQSKTPEAILNNPSAMEDYVQTGAALGMFDENSDFDTVFATLANSESEALKRGGADLNERKFQWEMSKFDKEFALKQQEAQASGSTIPFDVKQNYTIAQDVIKEVLDTDVADRGKLITSKGYDKFMDSYNAEAIKYGLTPFNISVTDKGDFNPFTPRYDTDLGIGEPEPVVQPRIATNSKPVIVNNAVNGDKDAIEQILENPDQFPQELVKKIQADSDGSALKESRIEELTAKLLAGDPYAARALNALGLSYDEIDAIKNGTNKPNNVGSASSKPYLR